MLLLVILNYYRLFHFKLIVYYRLFHRNIWLLVVLLLGLLVIINGYCYLFYWWLLVIVLLVAIDGYSITGYWCLFY